MTDDTTPRLSAAGCVFVTLAAAREAVRQMPALRWGEEEARRILTEALLDARLTTPATDRDPALYRARSRARQLDINARVVVEGRLAVVVAVSVRDYR